MWNPLQRSDWLRVGGGSALALLTGIMLGGAMQPNLTEDFTGPHTLVPGGGQRSVSIASQQSVADYGAQLPDYVVGTDWTRPRELTLASADVAAAPEPAAEVTVYTSDESSPDPMNVVRTRWRDEARDPVSYPSDRGGLVYETDLPAPPPAPESELSYADDDAG